MKVHHLLFIAWFIVFGYWLFRQFAESNRRYEEQQRRKQQIED